MKIFELVIKKNSNQFVHKVGIRFLDDLTGYWQNYLFRTFIAIAMLQQNAAKSKKFCKISQTSKKQTVEETGSGCHNCQILLTQLILGQFSVVFYIFVIS